MAQAQVQAQARLMGGRGGRCLVVMVDIVDGGDHVVQPAEGRDRYAQHHRNERRHLVKKTKYAKK